MACDYISMLGLKLIHSSERGPMEVPSYLYFIIVFVSIVSFSAVLSVWVAKKYFNTTQPDPSSSLSNWPWTSDNCNIRTLSKTIMVCVLMHPAQNWECSPVQKHSCQKGPVNHSEQVTNHSSAVIHIRQMATGSHVEISQAASTTSHK